MRLFKLRSQEVPCLRSPRGTLAVVAGVMALAMAPAAAAQGTEPPAWHDAGAELPPTVELADVAADGGQVIAVGHDEESGQAVAYSLVEGVWVADAIDGLPEEGSSTLTDVAIDGTEAWVVGTQTDPVAGSQPLVRRRGETGWEAPAAPLPNFEPTAVAVAGTTALIGDSEGWLHRFTDSGAALAEPVRAQRATRINDISLHAPTAGFAAGTWTPLLPGDSTVGIYELSPDPMPELADAGETEVDVLAIAATSAAQGVALDSTGTTWRLQDGRWTRENDLAAALPEGRNLSQVAALADGATGFTTEALAGSVPGAPGTDSSVGAIWRRYRFEGRREAWVRDPLPADTGPLTGVAVTGRESAWAVGADGTLLRYWRKPLPPPPPPEDDEEEEELVPEDEQQESEQQEEQQQAAVTPEPEPEPEPEPQPANEPPAEPAERQADYFDDNGVIVEQPPPKRTKEKKAKRLLKNVRVARKGRRKLVIRFRLTAPARVAVRAKRGTKLVAKTRMRTLDKGRRRLVVRFRGRPPSSLKVVVRPAPAAKQMRTRSRREK